MVKPLALTLGLLMATAAFAAGPSTRPALFPLSDVRLLDGPFKDAQEVDRRHLLAHSADRMLAPFRTEAGLPERAPRYGSWESQGLGGQTAGHYLSALSMMYAATGDAECKRRLDYMVDELAECQKANGNGYVGGVPNSKALWADIAAGRLKVSGFGLNDRWVPWYNLHKTFAGLRDAHVIGGNARAKDVLVGLADWCGELLAKLSDEQVQDMLRAEHGGMNEVLADVSALTGDPKYLALAKRFSHRAILDPLAQGRDDLTGKHANTQIPKVIGFERIAELSGDSTYHKAAVTFWDAVTTKRSVAIGGNSVNEHFHPVDNFRPMVEDRTGPETCNTYNMLRLTESLFAARADARYADFYERAVYNHILSSQHPEKGGFVYFTPMRPRHYRVYSQAERAAWCCVGTGMENHAKYGRFIYAHSGDALFVNLFIPSTLQWAEKSLAVQQETTFPESPRTKFTISLDRPTTFTLNVRHPAWLAAGELKVSVNGERQPIESKPSTSAAITRQWRGGDVVEVELPMRVIPERLPDGSPYVALRYGPVVLAAPVGDGKDLSDVFAGDGRGDHVSKGPLLPMHDAPTFVVDDPATVASHVRPVEGQSLTFAIADGVEPAQYRGLKLVPFHRVHATRYVLYFPLATPASYAEMKRKIEAEERERLALEAITLDRVTPGLQQSEVDHNVRHDRSSTGNFRDRSWRDARGHFSYELRRPDNTPADVLVTYYGRDRGRTFDVLANDTKLATVTLDGSHGDGFFTARYPLPDSLPDPVAIQFRAHPGSIAGGVFDVRLVKRPQ